MNENHYDLIAIGSGSGGLGISLAMLELGFKVLMIDKDAEKIGGECLNTGCVPSKALLHVAKMVHQAKKAEKFGINASGEISIQSVLEYVREKQDEIRSHENIDYLRKKGLHIVLGVAAFHSKKSVKVNGDIYSAKNIVICTGSSPRTLDVAGMETVKTFTNENIFDIDVIPEKFLFIGGGPVSIELAQAFARLGSAVTVVERGSRILKKDDPEMAELLHSKLREEHIQFYFESELTAVKTGGMAVLKNKKGEITSLPTDAIFMGLGRTLDFESLQLEKAGINTENGKIKLNQKLQTSNKNVYASGDAADNLKFSHAAEMHNTLLVNNFLSPLNKKLDSSHFPRVTFTDPALGAFGLNEKKLKKNNRSYERLEIDFNENDRAVTDDYAYGKLILFIEKKRFNIGSAKILGGSMLAPNAGEIAQELMLANSAGITISKLFNKVYPYPTASTIGKTIIRDRYLKELKPWMKKILKFTYNLTGR